MSLSFKYIPLTFLKDVNQVKEQIKNTVILRYLFDKHSEFTCLESLITGTQYGYNASALKSGKNKFLRISDITDGKVSWSSVPFCDCSDEETYLLNKNDLLIARTGGTTGKSFLINNPPINAVFAGYLIRIRANKENSPDFLNVFLNSYVYWSQVVSLNQGEFRPSVNATKLKELIIPKIEIGIQEEAVKISKNIVVKGYEELENAITKAINDFDKCQEIIENCKIQAERNKLLKQSILQDAIQGKLTEEWRERNPNTESASELLKRIRAEKGQLVKEKKIKREKALPAITEEEIPFKLPDGWVWCRLGDIIINSENLNIHNKLKPTELINYVDIDAIDNKKQIISEPKLLPVNQLSSRARRILKKGDILYSLVRPYLHNLAIVEEDKKNFIGSTGFAVFSSLYVDNKYIFWLLLSKYIEGMFMGLMDGFNSPSITQDQFRSSIIPLPPLLEQKDIIKKVEGLMEKCEFLEQEIENSETNSHLLMQSVLKEAFESKKEVV